MKTSYLRSIVMDRRLAMILVAVPGSKGYAGGFVVAYELGRSKETERLKSVVHLGR